LVVKGVFIGTLPYLQKIFAGKLGDLFGKCTVMFDIQGVYEGSDKVPIIQRFLFINRNPQAEYRDYYAL